MDIGKHLHDNRVHRGIALSQIAQSTKLSTTTLQYIEGNDFGRLPGGIFIRGYLRAFATAVGVNPDDVVRAYVDQLPVEPPVDEEPSLRDAVAAHHRLVVGLITAGLSVLIALAAYGVFPELSEPPAAPLPAVLEARPIGLFVAHAVAEYPPLAGQRPAQRLHLEIRATAKCWVSARADGHLVVHRFIESGERVIVVASVQLILQVDKPQGFVYTLNGEIGRPLGTEDTPVTVRITQQNLATFQTGSEAKLPGGERRSTT